MKKSIKTLSSILLLSSSLYAGSTTVVPTKADIVDIEEQHKFYTGIAFAVDGVKSHNFGTDLSYSLVANVGYEINSYLAIETKGSFSIGQSDDLEHDYSIGVYLKPQYHVNDEITMYGLVGYATTQISFDDETEINGIMNTKTTQSDFSYGIGMTYKYMDNISLYVDVMQWIDKSTTKPEGTYAIKVNSFIIGAQYSF